MTRKRSMFKRKRTYKRRYVRKARVPRNLGNKAFTFKRKFINTISPALNTTYGCQTFTISQLPNYTDFTSLFDRFRILKVVTKIYLRTGPDAQNLNNGNNSWYPKFYWYRDVDDTSINTSINSMLERNNVKVTVFDPKKPLTVTCVPNTLVRVYESATTSSYSPEYKKWIDCDNINTPLFGWKWAIDNIPSTVGNTAPYTFDFIHTFYFQTKEAL